MHNANEKQVGGTHYATGGAQHWDYVQEALNGAYLMGNVTKYVARHRKKNGLQDLEKAKHYLQKIMELYQRGELQPPRDAGDTSFPDIVDNFIRCGELTYWEGRVMVLACVWSNLNDLSEVCHHIHQMMDACEAQRRMDEERSAAEPGARYVDQDRDEPIVTLTEVEQFALWLSVQSPCIVVGSTAETPVILEAAERYQTLMNDGGLSSGVHTRKVLNMRCPIDFSNQTSKHIDVQSLRSRAVTIAKKHGERSEWVVKAVLEALESNLNGS